MTQEKELLLKDLCARLPYKVIVEIVSYGQETLKPWFGELSCKDLECFLLDVAYKSMRPYLRPLSSMTEEEVKEFYDVERMNAKVGYIKPTLNWHFTINGIDWLLKHHFDFRGLIPIGLALVAPEGMYE